MSDRYSSMMPVKTRHIRLGADRHVLATREEGRAAASALVRHADDAPSNFVLDFHGVRAATPPYLDELFDGLHRALRRHKDETIFAIATNLERDVRETIAWTMRETRAPGLPYLNGGVQLLTNVPQLEETMEAAKTLRQFTAPELAKKLGLGVPNASQRLARLVEAGALARRPDSSIARGRRYHYLIPPPELVNEAKMRSANPRPGKRRRAG